MDTSVGRLFARRVAASLQAHQSPQIVSGGAVPSGTHPFELSPTRVDTVRVGHAGRIQDRRPRGILPQILQIETAYRFMEESIATYMVLKYSFIL